MHTCTEGRACPLSDSELHSVSHSLDFSIIMDSPIIITVVITVIMSAYIHSVLEIAVYCL